MGMLFRPRPLVVSLAAEVQRGAPHAATGGEEAGAHLGALGSLTPTTISNRVRAERLVRAVKASVSGSSSEISDLYTEDVQGWSPNGTVTSSAELAVEFEDRDDAFSELEIVVVALDVGGDRACVEWVASVLHTGPLIDDHNARVDPTGRRLTLRGVTVAEFDGDRICSFRQYWNELEWLDQLQRIRDDEDRRPPA
jgi:hypothetical protein